MGLLFEKYVRNRLLKYQPRLTVDPAHAVITPEEFPDIRRCLGEIGKTRIEIDVIAYSDEKVYLISCKAPDLYRGPEMMRDLFFVAFEDFEDMIEWDLAAAGEIEDYARCVRESERYLSSRGLQGKQIIPILITSDLRPISLDSTRRLLGAGRIIPDVSVIQAMNIPKTVF